MQIEISVNELDLLSFVKSVCICMAFFPIVRYLNCGISMCLYVDWSEVAMKWLDRI